MARAPVPLILVFVVLYIFLCGVIIYFCMFADAEDSDMAYLLQIALPTRAWNQMNKFLGDKKMRFVEAVTDRFLIFVYLFIVLGCWCVVFFYIYPWITFVDSISNIHKYIGYFVFVSCFGSWRLTNTSSPGSINSQSFKRYDHYPYDHLLFLPGKRCGSTNLIKIPRSKFDRIKYKRNIPRYDHFCGWVHNTIGEENYRWFLLFLAVHVVMCAYGSLVCMLLFRAEIKEKKLLELTFFDRATGTSIQSSWSIVAQYLFAQKTLEASVMIIMFFMAIALGMFLSYHVYLTSTNQTTNENGKWGDVKKWYTAEKKRYEDAVKQGLVDPDKVAKSAPASRETLVAGDGDVTCTGGSSSAPLENEAQEYELVDPGPVPKNIHDKGFLENWKEVLFPISLRKNALVLGGYSRPSSISHESESNIFQKKSASSRNKTKST